MAERSPDEALARGRVLARNLLASTEAHITIALMAVDLAEVFQDLDEAMTGGGVPPEAWRPPRRPDQDQRNAAAERAVAAQLERLRQGSADRAEAEKRQRKQSRQARLDRFREQNQARIDRFREQNQARVDREEN